MNDLSLHGWFYIFIPQTLKVVKEMCVARNPAAVHGIQDPVTMLPSPWMCLKIELKELQKICPGLLKLPEEYSQRESFKVFRKGSGDVGKTLEAVFVMNKLKAALSHQTSMVSSFLFILFNSVF